MKKSQNIFQVLSTLLTKLGLKSKIKSYSGDFKNGHYHGKGRLEFTDGSVYEGQFENNKMHGYGKFFIKMVRFIKEILKTTYEMVLEKSVLKKV